MDGKKSEKLNSFTLYTLCTFQLDCVHICTTINVHIDILS